MAMLPKNLDRAERVARTLEFYKSTCLGEAGPVCQNTLEDFATDVRHFCEQQEFSFEDVLRISQTHYEAERNGEEE